MQSNQLTLKNVRTIDGHIVDHTVSSSKESTVDAKGKLTLFPALIDAHAQFSDWRRAAKEALEGGVTTVFDMGEEIPHKDTSILLDHYYYIPAGQEFLGGKLKNDQIAIKVMTEDQKALGRIFQVAAQENFLVVVTSQKIAQLSVEFAEKYSTELMLFNVNSKELIQLVKEAKKRELLIHAEVTAHDLLFASKQSDREELWAAIKDDTIDIIGSGHTEAHPSIKTLLPYLLTAASQHRDITLDKIVQVTRINVERIFRLKPNIDYVLADLEKSYEIGGHSVIGKPIYTILKGQLYTL